MNECINKILSITSEQFNEVIMDMDKEEVEVSQLIKKEAKGWAHDCSTDLDFPISKEYFKEVIEETYLLAFQNCIAILNSNQ